MPFRFCGLSLSSKPRQNSTQRRHMANAHPRLGPLSSNNDDAYGLNPPKAPATSLRAAQIHATVDHHDLPPAYSVGGHNKRLVNAGEPTSYNTRNGETNDPTDFMGESPLKVLENYDIVIVLDDSWSMLIADGQGGKTRWEQAWNALETLVRVGSKYDRDGIDIHFLNQRGADRVVMSEADVQRLRREVRQPRRDSYTPIGDVLDTLLLEYERETGDTPGPPGVKKRIFLVITDGAATDAPEYPIVRAAKFFQRGRFPLDQVGIQFIQVGNDPDAKKFLEELDEDLAENENTRDIVDTIKSTGSDLEGDALIKALTGGFNRRQDKAGERRR